MITDTIDITELPAVDPGQLERDVTALLREQDKRYVLGIIDINHYRARYGKYGPEYRNMVLNAIQGHLEGLQKQGVIMHHARSTEDQFTILYQADLVPHEQLETTIQGEAIGKIIRSINGATFPLLEPPEDNPEKYHPKQDVLLDRRDRSNSHIRGTIDAQHVTVRGAAVAFQKGVPYSTLRGALLAELSEAKKGVYHEIEGGITPNEIGVHLHVLDRYVR